MTQAQLAKLVGASQSHIADIERGRSQPSRRLIEKIAEMTTGAVPVTAWFPKDRQAEATE